MNQELNSLRTVWDVAPVLSIWTSIHTENSWNRTGHLTFGISSKVNHGPFEGLRGLSWEGAVGLVFDSTSSTIGAVGGYEGNGSLDPIEGWTINNFEISTKSALESGEREDSFKGSLEHFLSKKVSSYSDKWEKTWDEY